MTTPATTPADGELLQRIAENDPSWVLKYLEQNTRFDVPRIRELFEFAKTQAVAALAIPSPGKAEVERWQPIETAPKDGTVIDLWADQRRVTSCYWGLPAHCCGEMGSYCDSEWHDLKDGWVDDMNEPLGEYRGNPTHWMPLPDAPGAIQQERDKS